MSAIFFVWYNAIIFSLLQSFIFFSFFMTKSRNYKKNMTKSRNYKKKMYLC